MEPPSTVALSPEERCAQEPIHIIGHIQPHGLLFALSEPDLVVRQASANATDVLGIAADTLVGASFEMVLGAGHFAAFQAELHRDGAIAAHPLRVCLGPRAIEMSCIAHRNDDVLVVELEFLADAHTFDVPSVSSYVQAALLRMEEAATAQELAEFITSEIRAITGFDRVMVYRFDKSWTGEVIAESMRPSPVAYLGLRFPASDIPAQSRQLFLRNPMRVIADVTATPVPIVPERDPVTGRSLDLTRSYLRSAAAVHLEYLRNMSVGSSMTISIIVKRQLWGMIACHHAVARRIDYPTRSICALFGQILNMQLAIRLDNNALQARLVSRQRLEEYMADVEDSLLAENTEYRDARLTQLLDADGLLSRVGDVVTSLGVTLDESLLLSSIAVLRSASTRGIASCDSLMELDANAAEFAGHVSGALYIGMAEGTGDYLLFLRRELTETVSWAGNPDKTQSLGDDGGLRPRASFASWQETVHGHSRPWTDIELDSARLLREQLMRLREAKKLIASEGENVELKQLNDELAEFSYSISHDLRSPVRAVIGYATEVLNQHSSQIDRDGARLLDVVVGEATRMGDLIDDLLLFSNIGRLTLKRQVVDMTALAKQVAARSIGRLAGRSTTVEIEELPMVLGDPTLLQHVWSSLVENAVKYSSRREDAHVRVWGERENARAVYHVRDNGVGFDMRYMSNLFGVFHRMHPNEEFAGNGIGLAIVRRAIERHSGSVWVRASPGGGATFSFALPLDTAPPPG
jgi:light-regulated signal transduction histidine kinase (bacteriophytochrome)